MSEIKDYTSRMLDQETKLSVDETLLLNSLWDQLGFKGSPKELPLSAELAMRWELVWRLRPQIWEELVDRPKLPRFSNPFLNPDLVGPELSFITTKEVLPEITRLLRWAWECENSEWWPETSSIAEEYKIVVRKSAVEKTLSKLNSDASFKTLYKTDLYSRLVLCQYYLSRIILRGQMETTLEALKAIFEITCEDAAMSENPFRVWTIFKDQIAPLIALAYTRLLTSDIFQAFSFFAKVFNDFSRILSEVSSQKREDIVYNEIKWYQQLANFFIIYSDPLKINYEFFPTGYGIGYRGKMASEFIDKIEGRIPLNHINIKDLLL